MVIGVRVNRIDRPAQVAKCLRHLAAVRSKLVSVTVGVERFGGGSTDGLLRRPLVDPYGV